MIQIAGDASYGAGLDRFLEVTTLQRCSLVPMRRKRLVDLARSGRLFSTCLVLSISPLAFVREAAGHQACDSQVQEAQGQLGLAECEDSNLRENDLELNRIYKSVYHGLSEHRDKRHQLVEEERRWISSRDRECKDLVDGEDVIGTTRAYAMAKCMAEKTEDRISQLRARDALKISK